MRSKVFREHAPFVYFLLDGLLVRFTPRALEQAATRSWVLLGGRSSSCVFFHVAATAPFAARALVPRQIYGRPRGTFSEPETLTRAKLHVFINLCHVQNRIIAWHVDIYYPLRPPGSTKHPFKILAVVE
jgi:hypothetical protein